MFKAMEVSTGKINVRGLKRKEVRQLRSQGIKIGDSDLSNDQAFDMADAVVSIVLGASADDLLDGEFGRVFATILQLTYPTEETLKNFGSQSGCEKESDSILVSTASD